MSEQRTHQQNDEYPAFCVCLSRWPCADALDQALARIAELERAAAVADDNLDHALVSVGAFRQAIEDVWAKSAGESGEDGFIVSYVVPVGVLHRAIGLARGTDAGGKLLKQLRDAQECVGLLNSMVLSGEDHSDTSRAAVRVAMGGDE